MDFTFNISLEPILDNEYYKYCSELISFDGQNILLVSSVMRVAFSKNIFPTVTFF
jgi:hypothetical protein